MRVLRQGLKQAAVQKSLGFRVRRMPPTTVIAPKYGVDKGRNIPTIVLRGTHDWVGD